MGEGNGVGGGYWFEGEIWFYVRLNEVWVVGVEEVGGWGIFNEERFLENEYVEN